MPHTIACSPPRPIPRTGCRGVCRTLRCLVLTLLLLCRLPYSAEHHTNARLTPQQQRASMPTFGCATTTTPAAPHDMQPPVAGSSCPTATVLAACSPRACRLHIHSYRHAAHQRTFSHYALPASRKRFSISRLTLFAQFAYFLHPNRVS